MEGHHQQQQQPASASRPKKMKEEQENKHLLQIEIDLRRIGDDHYINQRSNAVRGFIRSGTQGNFTVVIDNRMIPAAVLRIGAMRPSSCRLPLFIPHCLDVFGLFNQPNRGAVLATRNCGGNLTKYVKSVVAQLEADLKSKSTNADDPKLFRIDGLKRVVRMLFEGISELEALHVSHGELTMENIFVERKEEEKQKHVRVYIGYHLLSHQADASSRRLEQFKDIVRRCYEVVSVVSGDLLNVSSAIFEFYHFTEQLMYVHDFNQARLLINGHPFFWSRKMKVLFICDFSQELKEELVVPSTNLGLALEQAISSQRREISGNDWARTDIGTSILGRVDRSFVGRGRDAVRYIQFFRNALRHWEKDVAALSLCRIHSSSDMLTRFERDVSCKTVCKLWEIAIQNKVEALLEMFDIRCEFCVEW